MTAARLKWYGWGREGEGMTPPERDFVLGRYREKFAVAVACQSNAVSVVTISSSVLSHSVLASSTSTSQPDVYPIVGLR